MVAVDGCERRVKNCEEISCIMHHHDFVVHLFRLRAYAKPLDLDSRSQLQAGVPFKAGIAPLI